jgi:hypothetical protein
MRNVRVTRWVTLSNPPAGAPAQVFYADVLKSGASWLSFSGAAVQCLRPWSRAWPRLAGGGHSGKGQIRRAVLRWRRMQHEPAPEPIIELVRACLDYVKRSLGTELDFTPETLPLLDHYLSEVREELAGKPELVELTAHAAGAYFGEVLRRQMRGFWHMPSASLHDFQICSSVAFVAINPFGVAYDALYGGTEHGGPRSNLRLAPEDHG